MKYIHLMPLAIVTAIAATSAFAQQAPEAAAQATSAPVAMDCAASPMKRHDHGAERGTGATAKPMPCAVTGAASSPDKAARKKPAHDHAKFHKNQ